MDIRSEVLQQFGKALGGRPVRWLVDALASGDFEGREETIEVFDVPQAQQRRLLRDLREARRDASRSLGWTVRVIFHTPEATTRYYSHVRPETWQVVVGTLPRCRKEGHARRSVLVDHDVLADHAPPRRRVA